MFPSMFGLFFDVRQLYRSLWRSIFFIYVLFICNIFWLCVIENTLLTYSLTHSFTISTNGQKPGLVGLTYGRATVRDGKCPSGFCPSGYVLGEVSIGLLSGQATVLEPSECPTVDIRYNDHANEHKNTGPNYLFDITNVRYIRFC